MSNLLFIAEGKLMPHVRKQPQPYYGRVLDRVTCEPIACTLPQWRASDAIHEADLLGVELVRQVEADMQRSGAFA